uniref:THAP domain-containing protein 6-like n=1 Tax=Doryrhamphus excisus TaxID=161450 RepID=UPI0025AE9F05|nr:THAP domain-containing protein 6-like [Doryrhamphus excisus]
MPHSCAAWSCTTRCTPETKSQGITFHRFPKDTSRKKQWEVALRREGFCASSSSMLCSEHFKPEDFDRTGQTVRLKDGVVPSVFSFPAHLQRPVAQETPAIECYQLVQYTKKEPLPVPTVDHSYVLPSSPDDLRARLNEALARVESLERERRNAKDRERRAKNAVSTLLEDLQGKKIVSEELKDGIDSYSDAPHTSTSDVLPPGVVSLGRQLLQTKPDRLKRTTPMEAAIQEDLQLKRRMIDLMEESERRNNENMQQLNSNIAAITDTIKDSLQLIRTMMLQGQTAAPSQDGASMYDHMQAPEPHGTQAYMHTPYRPADTNG